VAFLFRRHGTDGQTDVATPNAAPRDSHIIITETRRISVK